MGRSCLVLAGALGAGAASAAVTKAERVDATVWSVEVEDVTLEATSSEQAARLRLIGVDGYEGVRYVVGQPELPVVRFFVEGDVRVTAEPSRSDKVTLLGRELVAVQAPVAKRPGAKRSSVRDAAVYARDAFVSGKTFTVEDAGSVRGVPQRLVTLFPVDWNPATGELRQTRSFKVFASRAPETRGDGPGALAFVVAKELASSPSLAEYQAFKRTQGFDVRTIVYGADVTSVDGVRGALKTLLTTADLKNAVLIGDSNILPAKSAANMSGPTDHYFRAIDTASYDADIGAPDIGVGRIAVRTEAELAAVLAKYTRYQSRPSDSAEPWELGAAFAATSDSGFYRVAEATHEYVVETYTRGKGYFGNFPSARVPGGDKLYAITHRANGTNLLSSIREGRNFVIYSGHGYTGGWAGPSLDSSGIRSLSEQGYMPFVVGFACDTGDYRPTEGFAETWQRHPAGAVLYLGSVDSSYWDEDDVMERRLFDGIFAGKRRFGDVVNHALTEVWRQYGGSGLSKYYMESYTTFADPSVDLHLAN
jgi:hypothetical protein